MSREKMEVQRRTLISALGLGAATVATAATARIAGPRAFPALSGSLTNAKTEYKTQRVGEVDVFYRVAGPEDAPVILLLHGFPTSGHMFRDLIPALADRYRVIAPDLPGFGQTQAPRRAAFDYSFANLAKVIEGLVDAIGLTRYALYIFDYGAPTGLRLAMARPERVTAIVTQNGNAYIEGLSELWGPWQAYWRDPTPEHREATRDSLSDDAIRFQYEHGAQAGLVAPDGYTLDTFYMHRPEAQEIQLDLILSYRTNVALYPEFQAYFRKHRPPVLAVWGKNDPFFLPQGAVAYRRDNPDAEVHLLDAGHFALETHHQEIASIMRDFLGRKISS
ncbi:alpha/beta fold hydrolase [Sphingomonas sp. PAMC 26605]|uniref:alpha/beta fold hydrolase n=1 Tax=Sphingomonas sp. PAMC 26605 TaxID=1112214 RepID=UPI00030B3094|nr:alpha/beta hydrolase [Sphingomonas sp. PAMC 26605]